MHMLRRTRLFAPAALLLACSAATVATEPAVLDPQLDYQALRSNPVTWQIDFSVIVTPPYGTKVLRVWLPLAPSDAGQQVSEGEFESFPLHVAPQIDAEPRFGNRFAYFEFHGPQGAQIIRHRFQATVWQLDWELQPERVQAVEQWPGAFDRYRRSETQAVVLDEELRSLVQQIVPQPANPLDDLLRVMRWAGENFSYDHARASLTASSRHALANRGGHCSDYHGFCAAAGRALGYPTRIAYGLHLLPKNSPSHCKLEAYLPPYGWVSFDVSETQRLLERLREDAELQESERGRLIEAALARLTSGFRDHTWLCLTRGSDYDLAPAAGRRVAVVRTAYIEADGEPLPDPDPADPKARQFAWMTAHDYRPDRPVSYPFSDYRTLLDHVGASP
jgi:transglutaminase-like putative cysteine protease